MTKLLKFSGNRKEGQPEYTFHCPGCGYSHWFKTDKPEPTWQWNGDLEKPTVNPSILVHGEFRCHLYLRDGMIQFLNDCSHKLAGQTVPMEDYKDEVW